MEIGYINGDKVYVFKQPHHLYLDHLEEYNNAQIIKHRDLVRILNKLFKKIECAETREKDRPSGINFKMFCLLSCFANYIGEFRLPVDIKDEKNITFDDPQAVKKTRGARLHAGKCIKRSTEGLKVIKGGLYVEPVKTAPVEVLSGEGISFLEKSKNRETSPGTKSR